jgi:hypothetical protein
MVIHAKPVLATWFFGTLLLAGVRAADLPPQPNASRAAARSEKLDLWMTADRAPYIFRPGENIDVRFVFSGSGDKSLSYEVVDFWGKQEDKGVIEAKDGVKEVRRRLHFPEMGYAGVKLELTSRGKVLKKRHSLGILPGGADDYWARDPGSPFGIWHTGTAPDYYKELGIKWVRTSCYWKIDEPQKGKIDKAYEQGLANEFKQAYDAANVVWYEPYQSPPKWAVPERATPAQQKYPDTIADSAPVKEWDAYRAFLRRMLTVLRPYGGGVWETGNEFVPPWGWADTLETQVELQKVTYETVKAFDPKIRVACASPTEGCEDFLDDLFRLGLGKWIDILAYHPYPRLNERPEVYLADEMRTLKRMMAAHGCQKDIWITEIGWFAKRDAADDSYREENRCTEEEQADYLVRSHVLMLGEGVKHVLWWMGDIRYYFANPAQSEAMAKAYLWNNGSCMMHTEPSPDPIHYYWLAIAYGIMTRNLYKSSYRCRMDYPAHTIQCHLFEKQGEPIIVAWDVNGDRDAKLNVGTSSVRVTDIMGNTRAAGTEKGLLYIKLSPHPVYIHGASNKLLLFCRKPTEP